MKKAAAITVTGPEFREIVLSKYGRDLDGRICNAFYSPCVEPYVEGDRVAARHRIDVFLGSRTDQKLVMIGHNGFSQNQHLKILSSLAHIPEKAREKWFLIIPMGYGSDEVYRSEVETRMKQIGSGVVIHHFLSDEKLVDLRLATDVLIYTPISDAFSATVSQALAAGSTIILGSWLPYKLRLRAGFRYLEIDSPDEAGAALLEVVDAHESWQETCASNRQISRDFFDAIRVGTEWAQIYRKSMALS
jgi:glycosyltransferase involved in cell wall biosynthesis